MAPIPPDRRVRIGHVHVNVADLERALAFSHGVLPITTQPLDVAALLAERPT